MTAKDDPENQKGDDKNVTTATTSTSNDEEGGRTELELAKIRAAEMANILPPSPTKQGGKKPVLTSSEISTDTSVVSNPVAVDEDELALAKLRASEMASILPPDDEEEGGGDGGTLDKTILKAATSTATTSTSISQGDESPNTSSLPSEGRRDNQVAPTRPGAVAISGIGGGSRTNSGAIAEYDIPPAGPVIETNTTTTFAAEIVKEEDFEGTLLQRMKDRTVDAEKVQAVPRGNGTRESSRCLVLLILVGVICLATVATVLGVTSRKDEPSFLEEGTVSDSVPSPTLAPTATGTPAPTMTDFQMAVDLFSELSERDVLMDEATPQHQALSWLVDIDTANVLSNETMGSPLSSTSIERYVMALLYFATGGPDWMDEANFLNESSVCAWSSVEHGARCNDQGSVNSIRFVNNNLNGTIPSEISALSGLEQLTAFQSSLYGTIPESIGALTNLQVLQFGFSDISGSIPSTFTKLTKLAVMWMPANKFTGTLPRDLFLQLSSLEAINLSLSFITGTIPEFAIDQAILVFRLNAAMVSGKIPESIYMPTLNTLSFYGNQLSGSISSKIGELQELETFNVASNKLTGTLPTELGLARDLELLALSFNFISGTIPSELGLLDRLVELVMENNTLTGSVPAEFSTLSAGKVGLHTNNLTGGFGAFCDQPALQSKVSADCYGLDPLVGDCPCCTTCYDSSTGESEIILQSVCEIEQVTYENEVGTSFVEGAGTQCNCTSTGDNATLSCIDSQCQMCNRAGTVCAINQEYGTGFNDAGDAVMHKAEFQYVLGRDDTVTFETQYEQFYGWFCSVYVNGQLCNSCQLEICKDNESGYYVDCQNVEGAGIFEACGTNAADEIDEEGPLAVFSLQDPFRRDGCPPRFFKNF